MRFFVGLLILLSSVVQAQAKSGSLQLSGVVPTKAEVQFNSTTKSFSSLSSPNMKVEVQKRHPASIIRVSAP